MVRNIDSFGVLVPIIVTRDPETGLVMVVDGRQRVRHATEANNRRHAEGRPLLLVPASTRKGDSDAEMFGVMVATNEIRQADAPLIRAAKMARMKNLGWDEDAVALSFGVNKLTVQNTLALLDCGAAVRKAVQEGYIGISDVKYLSRLSPPQQTAKVAELVRATAGKVGHAKARAKREVVQGKPAAPKLKTRKEIIQRISDELVKAGRVGACLEDYPTAAQALAWVLGEAISEPEADTKITELVD